MLVHRRVTPSSKFAGTHLYTWVKRGTMRVKCLTLEHNTVPRPGLEPRPPDPESSSLTIRPPTAPPFKSWLYAKFVIRSAKNHASCGSMLHKVDGICSTYCKMLPQPTTRVATRWRIVFNLQCNIGARQAAKDCWSHYLAFSLKNLLVCAEKWITKLSYWLLAQILIRCRFFKERVTLSTG